MDLRSLAGIILTILCTANLRQTVSGEKLKLCIVESVHTTKRIKQICPLLVSTNQVECVIGNDRFNCLRRLTIGQADMTVLEPEDLVAASAYSEYNILVTNELRLFPDDKQRFKMVALVDRNIKSIWDIKGKTFCHPGFSTVDDWTNAFSTYFENWIIPKECDPDKTLLENRVHALSNYFHSACIAGPWSLDPALDVKLKSKYKNLCAICGNPVGCYTTDKYHGREGALLCLTEKAGDIAWVRLDDALEHFKDVSVDKADYSYLCPDGTARPMASSDPCAWITKPWPVVVARGEIAEKVTKLMNSLKEAKFGWETKVMELLESYHPTPVSTDTLETPEDFLRRFPAFMSANNRATCRPSRRVQWCVASNLEDQKCHWLREASFVYGIEPAIACIQEANRSACLQAVKSRRADIFVVRPDEEYTARKKGLKPIVMVASSKRAGLDRIAAVVKQDSRFRSLMDLRGAKACFTGYRNVGWNAFDWTMRNLTGSKWDCSDAEAVANFFKDSCVLGVIQTDPKMPANLFSLCKQGGKVGDDVSTFDCLTSGLGDVAVVNLKAIEKKTGSLDQSRGSSDSKHKPYRILCTQESRNDEEVPCILTWTTLGSIVAHENITDLRHEEIYSMLMEMDELFGKNFNGHSPAFSLYGAYNSNRSIIFPEQTHHLELKVTQPQRTKGYNEIVEDMVNRKECNGAHRLSLPYSMSVLSVVVGVLSQLSRSLFF